MNTNSKISLLVEGYPRNGFQVYAKVLGESGNGACITRLHPEYVAKKYGLEKVKRYWLSGQRGNEVISPQSLHHLIKTVRTELRGRNGNILFLDGLEYLLLYNDMSKVMAAMDEIDALLDAGGAELIIAIDPLTMEQRDVERFWSKFPHYNAEEIMEKFNLQQPQQNVAIGPASAGQTTAGLWAR